MKKWMRIVVVCVVALAVLACGVDTGLATLMPTSTFIQPTYTPYPTQVPPTPYPTQEPPTPYPTQVPTIAPVEQSGCAVQASIGGAMVYMGATGPLATLACNTFYSNVTSDPTFQGIVVTRVPYLPHATIYCKKSPDGGVSWLYMMSDSAAAGANICQGAGWPLQITDGG